MNISGLCHSVVSVFALSLLIGCSATIPAINPTPNIALVRQPKSLEIAFAGGVADQFDIIVGNNTIQVQSWRETLTNGFRNGFRSAYPAKQGANPDLTIQIDRASLELGAFGSSQARIQYAATLSGADGTQRRAAGLASRAAPMFAGFMATTTSLLIADVSASLADMYEQIAKQLFADAPPAAVARCVPGQSSACAGPNGCQGYQVCANDGARYEACSCAAPVTVPPKKDPFE